MPNCAEENPKFYTLETSEGTKIYEKDMGVIIVKSISFIEYQLPIEILG